MDKQNQAYIYTVFVVLIWSTIASAFKISLRYADFLQLTFFASVFSTIVFFITLVIQKKLILLGTYSKKDYLLSMILGFANPCLYYLVLLKAYSLLPAQIAQPLNYTWPLMLVLLSIPLLRQRVNAKSIVAIIISYTGVIIISTKGHWFDFSVVSPFGVLLALGSTVIWAFYWIFNTKDMRDAVVRLFMNFFFGSMYLFVLMLIFSKMLQVSLEGVAGALYIGVFEMGITFVLWLKALRLSKTTAQVSNLIYLTPFLSLVLINFMVGEKILFSTVIGLMFIVSGIVTQQYKRLS